MHLLVSSGDRDEGELLRRGMPAQLLQHAVAVQLGKREVEEDQIERVVRRVHEGFLAVRGSDHPVPGVREGFAVHLAAIGIVVREQDASSWHSHVCTVCVYFSPAFM